MRDNGVLTLGLGGYVLIVDGTFGYYYLLSGVTYVNSFGASLSNGSPTVTFPGALPNGLIVASTPTLSDSGGVIPAGTKVSSVDTIGLTLTMSAPATGNSFSDTVTLTIPVFGQITDPGFPSNPQRLWFIEGLVISQSRRNTQLADHRSRAVFDSFSGAIPSPEGLKFRQSRDDDGEQPGSVAHR